MPRSPRIQFAGASCHIVTRGDCRRKLFHDAGHYEQFTRGLEDGVPRTYKAFLVEDAGYYWTLSRYIHLNPCNATQPLVEDPGQCQHSSFPGYASKSKQVNWGAYDQLHTYRKCANGGKDPVSAYRKYVREGLVFPENPFKSELRQWVFGSDDFLRRMIAIAERENANQHRDSSRRLKSVSVEEIFKTTADAHDTTAANYAEFRSQAPGRDMVAWICHHWTGATLAEPGPLFALKGIDSVSNPVRRGEKRHTESSQWRNQAKQIQDWLAPNTENTA